MSKIHRIAITGGPGAGKSTAIDLFHREMEGRCAIVEEAATMLFSGGFPRSKDVNIIRATQKTIYEVQKNLEEIRSLEHPGKILLCDRGTLDSAVYWPDDKEDFFVANNSTINTELARYDAVLFFESAANGGKSIATNNRFRNESLAEAVELDKKLKTMWQAHPNFHFVAHEQSFLKKIANGLSQLAQIVSKLNGSRQ